MIVILIDGTTMIEHGMVIGLLPTKIGGCGGLEGILQTNVTNGMDQDLVPFPIEIAGTRVKTKSITDDITPKTKDTAVIEALEEVGAEKGDEKENEKGADDQAVVDEVKTNPHEGEVGDRATLAMMRDTRMSHQENHQG